MLWPDLLLPGAVISKFTVTSVAGLKLSLPACDAVKEHVPTLCPVTVVPAIVQRPVVVLAILTVSPLDDVAETDCDDPFAKDDC